MSPLLVRGGGQLVWQSACHRDETTEVEPNIKSKGVGDLFRSLELWAPCILRIG